MGKQVLNLYDITYLNLKTGQDANAGIWAKTLKEAKALLEERRHSSIKIIDYKIRAMQIAKEDSL